MASLILRKFGGMYPSANKKAIPEAAATYVRNLNLRFGDFRPMPIAANKAVAVAGSTLYKFDGSETFITKAGDVSFVRGQTAGDTTERTYYTGDGAPKVTDLTLAVRQLGVPAPTVAPSVEVNKIDEFSPEDATAAQAVSMAEMFGIIRNNMNWTYVGLNDGELAVEFEATSNPWEFSFLIPGTLAGGTFTPTTHAHYNLMDSRFGTYVANTGASYYGKVPMFLRGAAFSFDASLETDLDAMVDPSDPAKKLTTAEQRATIVSTLNSSLDAANKARDAAIARLRDIKVEFTTIANSADVMVEADKTAVQAFYARAEVTTILAEAKKAAAWAIRNACSTFNTVSS